MSYLGDVPTNARLFSEFLMGDESPITEEDFSAEELSEMRAMVERQDATNVEDEADAKRRLEYLTERSLLDWENNARSRDLTLSFDSPEGPTLNGVLVPTHTEAEWQKAQQEKIAEQKQKVSSFDTDRNKTSVYYSDDSLVQKPQGFIETVAQSFNSPAYNIETSLGHFNAFKNADGTVTIKDDYNYDNYGFDSNETTISLTEFLRYLPLAVSDPKAFGTVLARYALPKRNRDVTIQLGPYE